MRDLNIEFKSERCLKDGSENIGFTSLNTGDITETRFDEVNEVFGAPAITQAEAIAMESDMATNAEFRVTKQSAWADSSYEKFNLTSSMLPAATSSSVTDVPVSSFSVFIGMFSLVISVQIIRKKK